MKSKKTSKATFFVVLILILALTFTAFFGISGYYGDTRQIYIKSANDIRWGIDISGGVEAVFSPDKKVDEITNADMQSAKAVIERRLLGYNITDYEVYADNTKKQVIVRFPWEAGETTFDPISTVQKLGKTAVLSFCANQDQNAVILSGSADIASASAAVNPENQNQYVVLLKFTDSGFGKFKTATGKYSQISIWMDGEMISAPTVSKQITENSAQIEGNFTAAEAEELATQINAGSLPFGLTPDNSKLQVISPTLGANALKVMVTAGAIAFALVCLLMILRYRLSGAIASIALLGQLAGMIACISGYFGSVDSFTLTIPGIAGIILSIGVGVDANVIASERIREEFRNGKTIDGAIASGFQNSFSAVLDGNVTIVIIAAVLMGAFGSPDSLLAKLFSPIMALLGSSITGSIYSFGYTLFIGVIFNLIMGVLASKLMMKSISRLKVFRKPWLFGGAKNND